MPLQDVLSRHVDEVSRLEQLGHPGPTRFEREARLVATERWYNAPEQKSDDRRRLRYQLVDTLLGWVLGGLLIFKGLSEL